MTLVGRRSHNHPQQVSRRGPNEDVDDRATHPDEFAKLSERFGPFTIDVAAAAHNAKCERFYDLESDGLEQSWAFERVFCNPPYSSIEPWVVKAWLEVPECPLIVMLLPANRTEQGWWQRHVEPYRDRTRSGTRLTVEFLPGRMRFIKRGQTDVGPNERPPFGCCLLIWDGS